MIVKFTNSNINGSFINCRYSTRLLHKICLMNKRAKNKVNLDKVKKAIYYAQNYHARQRRKTGEPFYAHPLEVAYMVADYLFTTDMIVTSILHDTVEDTELTKAVVAKEFGDKIANQVEDLTRIKADRKISSVEIIETLYRQKKNDLLLIKLFDRLHNMQTVEAKSAEKIWKTTAETLQIFLTLANYLKMPDIAQQLNKHCMQVISSHKKLSLYDNVRDGFQSFP